MSDRNIDYTATYQNKYRQASFAEIADDIHSFPPQMSQKASEYRLLLCDSLIDHMSNCRKYESTDLIHSEEKRILKMTADKLPKDEHYYRAVSALYYGENDACLNELEAFLLDLFKSNPRYLSGSGYDDELTWFSFTLAVPFKNAFPGFWSKAEELLLGFAANETVLLCRLLETYFDTESPQDRYKTLKSFLTDFPNNGIVLDLLSQCDLELGYYKEAAEIFEEIADEPLWSPREDILYDAARAYSALGDNERATDIASILKEEYPDYTISVN